MNETKQPETEDILRGILSAKMPKLPPQEQRFGASTVRWWEGKPGDVIIMAEGGTADDRYYAETLVGIELSAHGYKRAQFSFDQPRYLRKQASWVDIMAKAKRLMQSGNVTILRNGWNNLIGHVIGDHGEYNCEIGRDDPESRAITTWTCECPWDQYAWQRTRQWKKYEGRCCAHVLALYWTGRTLPLDDHDPNVQGPVPLGQKQGPPPAPMHGPAKTPAVQQPGSMDVPQPPSAPSGPHIPGPPPDAMGGPPGPAQAPMAPPSPPGALPQPPMEAMQQMMQPPPMPGMSPVGVPAPPNSVSVPGARPPSPFNPVQYPGGTYSKVASNDLRQALSAYAAGNPVITDDGSGRTLHELREPSKARGWCQDVTDHFNAWMEDNHPHIEAYPEDVDIPHDIYPDAPQRAANLNGIAVPEHTVSRVILPDGSQHYVDWAASQYGYNEFPKVTNVRPLGQRQSAEFNPPEIVKLKQPIYGVAEGKSEEHGAGQYREVPMNSTGEVLSQDETTGWVEVIFPIHDASYNEPFHVRCFVEPKDLSHTTTQPPGPFIKRR